MTEGKLIQDVVNAFAWFLQKQHSEKKARAMIIESAKAYAASEVERLKKQGDEFIDQRNHFHREIKELRESGAAKDAEIAELVDANATMQSMMVNQETSHGATTKMLEMRISQLEAEIKRLRESTPKQPHEYSVDELQSMLRERDLEAELQRNGRKLCDKCNGSGFNGSIWIICDKCKGSRSVLITEKFDD